VELRANRAEAAVLQYGNALRLFREAGAESSGTGAAVAARYSTAVRAANRPNAAPGGSQSFR
jgi:hypothetical protein